MKMKTPEIVLTTREETLAFLASHDEMFNGYDHPVKPLWLCEELNRFEADGYVYNAEAQHRICAENGLDFEESKRRNEAETIKTEGGLLGYLIYQAQGYRREMNLEKAGWTPATQEALKPFAGKKVAAINNGGLSGELVAMVKFAGERFRLCPLRSRTKAYSEWENWWIKPVEAI